MVTFVLALVTFLTIIFALYMLVSSILTGQPYSGKKRAHFADGVFSVAGLGGNDPGFTDVIAWQLNKKGNKKWLEPYTCDTVAYVPPSTKAYTRVTFINHSTVLIENEELSILTDPVFSLYASPVQFMGPKRHHDPYLSLESIPTLDVVVISHNHYDHLSLGSIKQIETKFTPQYLVPLNNGQFLQRAGVPADRIVELDLFEQYEFKNTRFTLEKAQHWSSRFIFDKNRYLWGSYLIETQNKKLYFAGDTGYNSHFAELKEKYGPIDFALLPIGAYEPQWFMKTQHMNPTATVQAAIELDATQTMGIHFGTFKLTDEGRYDPEIATYKALQAQNYLNTFLVPTIKNGIWAEF
jgi:L-ascorbate metabolism protein UlaG (beta-lactamase superfamily)